MIDEKIFKQFQVMIEEAVDTSLSNNGFDCKKVVDDAYNFLDKFIDCRITRDMVEFIYDSREAEYCDWLNESAFLNAQLAKQKLENVFR